MREYEVPNPDYPTELIDQLKRYVDHHIVKAIAQSDYGYDAPEHKAAIQRILDEERVPRPIQWEPGEPFSLCKWWDHRNHKEHEISGLNPGKANIARAFCCACLLTYPEYGSGEPFDAMIRLVDSVIRLDITLALPCFDMLSWIQQCREGKEDEDSKYETMTAELCKCLLKAANLDCPVDLSVAIPKLIRSEREFRDEEEADDLIWDHSNENYRDWNQWLIGMSYFDQSWDICFDLVRQLFLNPKSTLSAAEQESCKELATIIL
ncbi:MAG: hypothetical protein JJ974_02850 [Phycisphaerales bacterium]|nr:hypothetical protein [Phycisphaerales bacterium]